ncbi:hypothetical protein E2320_022812 [Naja naja]|nr:hypothetical protein E2320_022812 [Naja naja]
MMPPSGEIQPAAAIIALGMTPTSPTDLPVFLPGKKNKNKKEDRPQPEGAGCDTTTVNATAGSEVLSECSQIVMEQALKSGGTRPRSPGCTPGTELQDARIVMGEETHCLGVALQEAPTVPKPGVLETASGEESSNAGDKGLEVAFQCVPPPVARDYDNLHAFASVPPPGLLRLQEPVETGVSPLSQDEPMADVPSPSPTLAKNLPAVLAESPLLLAKYPGSLEAELYFTAPSTPIRTLFPPLRQPLFSNDGMSEEPNEVDSEGLGSPPTSPSGSYITAEGGSWTSMGTASTSSSCSPNLFAEAEALEAPTVDEEALAELELPEGDPKLSRVTCPTFGAFPWRSYNTFPLLYPAQEYSGGEEEEQSPSEESWGFGTTPLELPSREVEQVYPSWLPHFDESEEDTDSVSALWQGTSVCCLRTTQKSKGVFGVAHDEEGEPGGLQSQLPTPSPEDDMKTIESDQMIPALLLPSVVASFSKTSIDEGVDESFAYPYDTCQSSDSASDDSKDGVEQDAGSSQTKSPSPRETLSMDTAPESESKMDVSWRCTTQMKTPFGNGEEQTRGESEEKRMPKEEKLMQGEPIKNPRSFDTMVVSQLQARSESQGGGSSRNSCISHPAPGEEDSVVTFEEWSLPTQDDKEEESLKEMVLFHLSTHQPHPDVQPTHLEKELVETDDNPPNVTYVVQESGQRELSEEGTLTRVEGTSSEEDASDLESEDGSQEEADAEKVLLRGTEAQNDGEEVDSIESPHNVGNVPFGTRKTETVEVVRGILPAESIDQMRSSTTTDNLVEHPEVQKKTFAEALLQGLLLFWKLDTLCKEEEADATRCLWAHGRSPALLYLESSS